MPTEERLACADFVTVGVNFMRQSVSVDDQIVNFERQGINVIESGSDSLAHTW
jgi:hypothetical protein